MKIEWVQRSKYETVASQHLSDHDQDLITENRKMPPPLATTEKWLMIKRVVFFQLSTHSKPQSHSTSGCSTAWAANPAPPSCQHLTGESSAWTPKHSQDCCATETPHGNTKQQLPLLEYREKGKKEIFHYHKIMKERSERALRQVKYLKADH